MTVTSTKINDTALLMTVSGDFVAGDADAGHDAIEAIIKDGHSKVSLVVDLSQCGKFTKGGMIEDMKKNMSLSTHLHRFALIDKADQHSSIHKMLQAANLIHLMKYKAFDEGQLEDAKKWVSEV